MGGYAAFVWPSYALATLGLVGIFVLSRRSVSRLQNDLDRLRPRGGETTSESKRSDVPAGSEHP